MKSYLYRVSILVFSAVLISLTGCKKEYQSIEEVDQQSIERYMAQNNLTGFSQKDDIYYKIVREGAGAPLDYTKEVPLIFKVRSLDGSFVAEDTFTAYNRFANYLGYLALPGISQAQASSFRDAIKEGLKKEDGEIRLIIPSRLGYGRDGYSFFQGYNDLSIAGNSSLDVTVTVIGEANLAAHEDAEIRKYLGSNLGQYTKTESGLYYKISELGSGSPVGLDSTIVADYTGKLLNGTQFDSATSAKFQVSEGGLIPGWVEALPKIKEGGSIHFICPSHLAYKLRGRVNDFGVYTIPAFSPLDFQVKVTDVSK